MSAVLSILIPTRNRPIHLQSLLSIIGKSCSKDIEFIVSDNSDAPVGLVSVTDSVKFIRPERILNMTDHWNFMASRATGDYLTFVGDDDAFIPTELDSFADFLSSCEADLVWTPPSGYIWPKETSIGNFYQEKVVSPKIPELTSVRKRIARMDLSVKIPIPYNGNVFKRSIIQKFEDSYPGEKFFSSRIPDVNSGVKLLFLSEVQAIYPSTVFISGTSPLSNGYLTKNEPEHPRALEFNNDSFNPAPKRGGWPAGEVPPFGYITFFEAIQESLIQLKVPLTFSKRLVAFKSVLFSSSPRVQKGISERMWPQHRVSISFGYIFGSIIGLHYVVKLRQLMAMANVFARAILGFSSVTSLRGYGLSSTLLLVEYLESSRILRKKRSFPNITIRKNC